MVRGANQYEESAVCSDTLKRMVARALWRCSVNGVYNVKWSSSIP